MFTKVVVGVDGRESGRDAIAFARAVAPGAELVLVRAFTYGTIGLLAQAAGWDDAVRESTLEALARAREEAGVDADVEAIADRSPARALQNAAARANADLLILGSGHHGRFGRVVLGDFGRAVMAGAPCAVAVASRSFASAPIHTVGVGIDGSRESAEALAFASGLAQSIGAQLRVLVIVDEPLARTGSHPWMHDWREHAAKRDVIARRLQPGFVLVEATRSVDVMVVGSRRWAPARQVLLGSTSDRLVHHAHCPVVVVPRGALVPVAAS